MFAESFSNVHPIKDVFSIKYIIFTIPFYRYPHSKLILEIGFSQFGWDNPTCFFFNPFFQICKIWDKILYKTVTIDF